MMTGHEFKAARKRMGLTVVQMGLLMGYDGNLNTISKTVRGYEARRSERVPGHIGRLVDLLVRTGLQALPLEWLAGAEIE